MHWHMPSPAMVVALIALGVALSGTAVAASNALIGSKDIANHSIRLVDINPDTVKELRGQRGADGAPGANGATGAQGVQGLPGAQGAKGDTGSGGSTGSAGTTGPAGAPGSTGASGTFDPNKLQYVEGTAVVVAPGATASASAVCPTGTTAISGGFFASISRIGFSETFGKTFHGIAVTNDSSIDVTIYATVVCAA